MVSGAGRPVTVAEVVVALAEPTAYTTAMTTLARLHDKGALVRERLGRGFAYAPAAAPESLPAAQAARQMRRLLDGHGTRADVLARFVAELTADDEAVLLGLLADPGQSPTEPAAARPS
jgi:predicted transcriptional regulator